MDLVIMSGRTVYTPSQCERMKALGFEVMWQERDQKYQLVKSDAAPERITHLWGQNMFGRTAVERFGVRFSHVACSIVQKATKGAFPRAILVHPEDPIQSDVMEFYLSFDLNKPDRTIRISILYPDIHDIRSRDTFMRLIAYVARTAYVQGGEIHFHHEQTLHGARKRYLQSRYRNNTWTDMLDVAWTRHYPRASLTPESKLTGAEERWRSAVKLEEAIR